MKFLYAVGVVALLLIILAISAIWADPTESVSAQVPACIVDGTPVPCPTATPVPPTSTPVPTATATPVPPTPIVITNTVVYRCEGPYSNLAPYALAPWQMPVNFGLNVYQYGGLFNWPVPTLVIRTNGQVTQAFPNAPECLPVKQEPPVAPSTATPAPAPQVIVVQQPAQAVEQPRQPVQVTSSSMIRPPSTGSAGLLAP